MYGNVERLLRLNASFLQWKNPFGSRPNRTRRGCLLRDSSPALLLRRFEQNTGAKTMLFETYRSETSSDVCDDLYCDSAHWSITTHTESKQHLLTTHLPKFDVVDAVHVPRIRF